MHHQLGQKFFTDEVLEALEASLAQVAGEVLRAHPEENARACKQHEKTSRRQACLEGRNLARSLVKASDAEDLEKHDILLILELFIFIDSSLTVHVLIGRHDHATLEGLE